MTSPPPRGSSRPATRWRARRPSGCRENRARIRRNRSPVTTTGAAVDAPPEAPAAPAPFPTLADVRAAAARIAGVVRRTPLLRSDALSELAGTDVRLKLETLQ